MKRHKSPVMKENLHISICCMRVARKQLGSLPRNNGCGIFIMSNYSLQMIRIVEPEILDRLQPDDPDAVRSRRDLRLINKLMGGQAWIVRELAKIKKTTRVVELGAGDGELSNLIQSRLPDCKIVALDLVPRPDSVDKKIEWESIDVLDYDGYDEHTIVVANLFIHHLKDNELKILGEKLKSVRAIFFAEPYRGKVALNTSKVMVPFVNHVTRHDMRVSIKAGFYKGEMAELLGNDFQWDEAYSLFGGIRMKALR